MTTSRIKKVSVVVPNYNYAKYLKKRIYSIVRQTYPIYELIILDDKSTDDSIKKLKVIISKLEVEFPKLKVKILENEKNSGKAILQWKKGLTEAKGDFVWIAEADDLSSRKFLEETMRAFDDAEVMISYSESMIINDKGMILAPNFRWSRDKERTGHFRRSYIKDGMDEIREVMAIRCTIPNVSSVVLRKDARMIKYLEEAARFSQVGDWYFYVKILKDGKISYNHKARNKFRIHRGSVTQKSKSGRKHYEEVKWMHEKMRKFELPDTTLVAMENEEKRILERMRRMGV